MTEQTTNDSVMRIDGGPARPEVLSMATGEETMPSVKNSATDDGLVPKPTGSTRHEESRDKSMRLRLRNQVSVATSIAILCWTA